MINKGKSKAAHIQASELYTSNDKIVNGGLILAGFLVCFLNRELPNLIISATAFTFGMQGGKFKLEKMDGQCELISLRLKLFQESHCLVKI